jgi:hypothetical protein
MPMSALAMHWFEIHALDLDRACRFHHAVLDGHVRLGTFGAAPLEWFDVPCHSERERPFSTAKAIGSGGWSRPAGERRARGTTFLDLIAIPSSRTWWCSPPGGLARRMR